MTVAHAIRAALSLLSRRDRRLLLVSIGIQMATSVLDLIGVLLIGLVGALSVAVVQSQPPPPTIAAAAELIGLGGWSTKDLVVALSVAAAAILLLKSGVSVYLTRRVFVFLANRQALVSARLSKELLSRPLTFIQKRSSQETAFALIQGAGAATVAILGQLAVALTEVALLGVLSIALLLVSPGVAIGAIAYFMIIAWVLQRSMGSWAGRVAYASALAEISSLNAVQEAVSAYREVTVADRRPLYVQRIQMLRWEAARYAASGQFISMIPKYVFEASMVLGGFLLAGALFTTQSADSAIGTFAVFLAAASRIMPSLLRLQGATLGLRAASGLAKPTFDLANELGRPTDPPPNAPQALFIRERIARGNPDFKATVTVEGVSVTYPGAQSHALNDVSLSIPAGSTVALVGRSGAGKSTLVDVVLGVLAPAVGTVLINGLPPTEAIRRWPGGISYVPQEVVLANDSVRANVALGLPEAAIDDTLVWEALHRAHLSEFVSHERGGLSAQIGEAGVRLSGGQRQRLGIARALYTRPKLLVLDEATSALDVETESAISAMIQELGADVTRVIIAHRLSTVKNADELVYLDAGRIVAQGSFDDVVRQSPAFSRQARMMGLI